MSADLRFQLTTSEDTTETFARLRRATRKSVVRQSTAAGGRVQAKAVKKAAPRKSGLLTSTLTSKVKQYPSGTVVAVIGQSRGGRFGERAAKRISKLKQRGRTVGGLSGRGQVVPIHLVDQPVASHEIAGVQKFGKAKHPVSRVQHPGHLGKQFLLRAAKSSAPESLAKFAAKFAERTESAAAKLGASEGAES